MNPLALTCEELTAEFQARYGRGRYHAAALYRAFYLDTAVEIGRLPEFTRSEPLADRVRSEWSVQLPEIVHRESEEGVTKLLFRLNDGLEIETVILPSGNRITLCASSQVGCRMGCRFCRTGKMGLQRNLRAEEIVAQVYTVKVVLGHPVRNIVFMGMGEPLDNFDQLIQAIRVIEDQRGLNIGKRRMTVSTVGLVPGIERLSALNWPQLKLAVSINAPNDDIRSRLMPVNRHYRMSELKSVLQQYPLGRGNALYMEYVLIKGVNDHPDHARQLSEYFNGLTVKLNLIPYNPDSGSEFEAPTAEGLERFRRALIDERIFVRRRSPRGAGIQAACGQLGGRPFSCVLQS